MVMKYEQAKSGHDYLWSTYGEAYDMTGGYVDQDDLKKMLASPTKATAARCLCSQIAYWFSSGYSTTCIERNVIPMNDPKVCDIAERHFIMSIYT